MKEAKKAFLFRGVTCAFVVAAVVYLVTVGTGPKYFPDGAEGWYPEHLKAMREPSLYRQDREKSVEQYRFLWLRSFHKPIAVRIWKAGEQIGLRVIQLNGAGGYHPGGIEHDKSFAVTASQWNEFKKLLDDAAFWKLASADKVVGCDGSQWVLEGRSGNEYQVVDRWSASGDSANRGLDSFVACCRYLLKISMLEVPEKEDY